MNHALPSPSNSPLPTHILFQSFSSKARATSPVAAVPLTEMLRRWPSTPVPPFLPPAHVRGTSLTAFQYLPPTLSFQHVQCACAQCLTTEREACSQGDLHHVRMRPPYCFCRALNTTSLGVHSLVLDMSRRPTVKGPRCLDMSTSGHAATEVTITVARPPPPA